MKAELTEQITVRVTAEMLADLQRLADETERTVAQLVRFVIKDHLKGLRTGEKSLRGPYA